MVWLNLRNQDVWAALDGRSGAPSGGVANATLLSGYTARPAWQVAGVDYGVGIDRTLYPTNGSLKDPASISIGGVTVNTTTKLVTVNAAGVTLDGYDFSLNNGWAINQGTLGSSAIISNSYFLNGSNNWAQGAGSGAINGDNGTATGITITKCILDGNGAGTTGKGIIQALNNTGPNIVTYCLIKNAWAEHIVSAPPTSGSSVTIKYNVLQDSGMGAGSGAHGDFMQFYQPGTGGKAGSAYGNVDVSFNLCVQSANNSVTGAATQGWSISSANIDQNPLSACSVKNNTMICASVANVNYIFAMDSGNFANGQAALLQSNYVDLGGVATFQFFGAYNGAGTGHGNQTTGTLSESGNINMVTGATVT